MLEHWLAVLQRPPSTWSAGEVACWARTVPERHGAGMPWLASVLERNCIGDGDVGAMQLAEVHLCQAFKHHTSLLNTTRGCCMGR